MDKFFYGDSHYGHPMMAKMRGFENSYYMDEYLIKKYKEAGVTHKDEVYFMGDVSYKKPPRFVDEILKRLPGKKFLIIGNHDKSTLKCADHFQWISPLKEIKIRDDELKRKLRITLCHYCMRTWPAANYGSWHICAHSHGKMDVAMPGNIDGGLVIDSGCDNYGLSPAPYETLREILLEKERLLEERRRGNRNG